MQDKLLFAAGVVALLIGLFVGVRSDNVRKAAEENLANVSRQVTSVKQQLQSEEGRNKVIADKLDGMEGKLDVARDKLSVANKWYANLQKTNARQANDVYTIRLAMVGVLADLKAAPSAAGQASISEKIDKLVKMLDEHNAEASAGQPAAKEEATAPEQQPAAEAGSKKATKVPAEGAAGVTEKAPAAAPEKEKESSSVDQEKKSEPAVQTEKSGAGAPKESAPVEKKQEAAPAPQNEEKKEGAVRL